MTERLLRQADIAAMLGTSPGVAASVLAEHGVYPVDFGIGRSRGQRWLQSAVVRAMENMHEQAQQPKHSQSKPCKAPKFSGLAAMSIDKILELTKAPRVQ